MLLLSVIPWISIMSHSNNDVNITYIANYDALLASSCVAKWVDMYLYR